MELNQTLVIGFDISDNEKDLDILAVGRKDGEITTIINMFIGKEAREMYDRLTTVGGYRPDGK